MANIELRLRWPPTINSYYQVVGRMRGIKRISHAGLEFRKSVLDDMYEQLGSALFLTQPLSLTCIFYAPDRRIRDLDNYIKPLQDALTHAKLWEDDSIIDQLHVYRGVVIPKGLVHLRLADAGPVLPMDGMALISQ